MGDNRLAKVAKNQTSSGHLDGLQNVGKLEISIAASQDTQNTGLPIRRRRRIVTLKSFHYVVLLIMSV